MSEAAKPRAARPAAHTTHATGRQKLLGHGAMMLFALLIAGSFSLGARAAPHVDSAALNAVRFLFGVALMGALAIAVVPSGAARIRRLPPAAWRFAVLGALMATYFLTMFVALQFTHPVATGAVFTLIPLMSAVFGYLTLGQRVRPVVALSLLIAAAGSVWVIFRGDLNALLAFQIGRGEAIFFVGCAAHALYAPLVKRFSRGEPLALTTFWTLAATGLWIVLIGAGSIVSTDWPALPAVVWLAIGYLAVFATAVTFLLVQFASLRLPAAKVMSYGYLTPSFIILLEGLGGQGWVGPSVAAGALMTTIGLVVLALAPDR